MRVDDFDFDLPPDRIALRPVEPRDAARLLAVEPDKTPVLSDRAFAELPSLLRAGDVLVFNDTKVIPARLFGKRIGRGDTTPRIEVTLHRRVNEGRWHGFAKPARKLEPGDAVRFGPEGEIDGAQTLGARVSAKLEAGEIVLDFEQSGPDLDEAVAGAGVMPLPPYIASKRAADEQDLADYQTVYAAEPGAVAAPTAGLHFTHDLLRKLGDAGIENATVTLHVGAGTFLPVKVENTEDHRMHAEWGEIDEVTADRLNDVRQRGGRVVAVGTTALRLLESAVDDNGRVRPFRNETSIFITPGYRFRAVDLLITNFHLPRSTLFMLVCAFCGMDVMRSAYDHAVEDGYRFYSYGDACLLSRRHEN